MTYIFGDFFRDKFFWIENTTCFVDAVNGKEVTCSWIDNKNLNVNRFPGFLVPRPDWIKVLYLFGTLGLHRLLTKTLKFFKNFKISKFS
jgi:hypothetical protein